MPSPNPPARLPTPQPALPDSDALYRLLVENLTDYAVMLLSPDGFVVTWTEGAARVLGWTEAEMIGASFARLYPPDDVASGCPENDLKIAAEQGRCDALAWRMRGDGKRLWATSVLTAMRDEAGALLGFGLITRDLTDRKEAADRYEESRQRWRSLFEHNPDAVLSLDLEGGIVGVNPAAAALTGVAADALRDSPLWFLIATEDRERLRTLFAEAAAGEPRYAECTLQRPDHRTVDVSVALVPIRVADAILGVYCIAEDVTMRNAAEAEREILLLREQTARAEAEIANRAKSDFLAVVSHELRTPLNAITGFADLFAEGDAGPMSEVQLRHLERIRVQARHLARMVDDVLAYVRLERGEELPGLAVTDLRELVHHAADIISPVASSKSLTLNLDLPTGALHVRTDRMRTAQVLHHLLTNAVKFTETGEIHIVVRSEPDTAVVEVRDTGMGIDGEVLHRIWEPFWQADHPLVRRAGGTGLGLSLVQRITELLGGSVAVQSEPGQGTTFTLRIPNSA